MSYFLWLGMAVVVEGLVLLLALRQPVFRTLLYCLLINGITHPLAWWVVRSGSLTLLPTELLVAAVETALIALSFRIRLPKALGWSCAANAASAGAGLVVSVFV